MRVLALGAHPDDLEIFAWGSLCAFSAAGARLTLAIATDGAAGGATPGPALAVRRAGEAQAAAAPLGVEPRFLGFGDGTLMADRPLVAAIAGLLAEVRPDLVLAHDPGDYHHDHRALATAAVQAAGFSAPVLHMDVMGGTGFRPSHWIDVGRHWPAKLAAIRAHASQDPERFVAMAERQAAFRAGECNGGPAARAEAFRHVPRFPFADIRVLLPPAPPLCPVAARSGAGAAG